MVSLKGRIKRKPWVSFKEGVSVASIRRKTVGLNTMGFLNYVPFISGSLILITFLVGLHETGLSLN